MVPSVDANLIAPVPAVVVDDGVVVGAADVDVDAVVAATIGYAIVAAAVAVGTMPKSTVAEGSPTVVVVVAAAAAAFDVAGDAMAAVKRHRTAPQALFVRAPSNPRDWRMHPCKRHKAILRSLAAFLCVSVYETCKN